jgi:hypothetical protein
MCFVDTNALWLWWLLILEDILFRCRWIPEPGIVDGRNIQVLSHSCDPNWETFQSLMKARGYHGNLDFRVVLYRRLSMNCRKCNLKHSKLVLLHFMRISVPIILVMSATARPIGGHVTEISNEKCLSSIWSPFSIHNVLIGKHMETICVVTLYCQSSLQRVDSPLRMWPDRLQSGPAS